jgi:hypothetical protein
MSMAIRRGKLRAATGLLAWIAGHHAAGLSERDAAGFGKAAAESGFAGALLAAKENARRTIAGRATAASETTRTRMEIPALCSRPGTRFATACSRASRECDRHRRDLRLRDRWRGH